MTLSLIAAFALLILVILLTAVTLFGVARALSGSGASDSLERRLQNYAYVPIHLERASAAYQSDRLARFRVRFNNFLSIFVSRRLNEQLGSANWPITTSEFALIRLSSSLLVFAVGWWLGGTLLPGVGLAILTYLAPSVILRQSIAQRRSRFERQLVDILVLMTGAVRAGYSLLQSLSVVEQEISAPASEEIGRVTREVELGRSLGDALNGMARRMENDDLQLVVTSININQQVGGNMATMLEAVTDTIRERQRLFGEIRAQTAQQRFTGFFLTLLPVIVAALLFILNPQYMETFFDVLCIPIGALTGSIIGTIIVARMLNFKV